MLSLTTLILIAVIGSYFFLPYFGLNATKSEIKSCQVYNLEKLTCYWDQYIVNNIKINVDLYYKKGDFNFTKCERRDHDDSNATMDWCQLSYKKHNIFHIPFTFKLQSSNPSLVSSSDLLTVNDLYNIYKPGLIHDISATNTTSTTALISWKAPNNKDHLYNIQLYGSMPNNADLNTTNTTLSLSNLFPYTDYHLSIRSILHPFSAAVWSDWVEFHFETHEDVPRSFPVMFEDGFQRLRANHFKIIWQVMPASLKSGRITTTRIRSFELCGALNSTELRNIKKNGLKEDEFVSLGGAVSQKEYEGERDNGEVEWEEECDHLVFVDMASSRGFNTRLSLVPLWVPAVADTPKGIDARHTKASVLNEGDFSLEWDILQNASSYLLFYWLNSFNSSSNYSSLITSNSSFKLSLPLIPKKTWRFAVSTQYLSEDGDSLSSGMVETSCVYNRTRNDSLQLLNLQYKPTACSVLLHWSPQDCTSNYPPYFTHYAISYCPSSNCYDQQEIVVARWHSSYTLENLQCGIKYHLNLSTVTDSRSILHHQVEVVIPPGSKPWIWVVSAVFGLIVLILIIFFTKLFLNQKKYIKTLSLPVHYSIGDYDMEEEYRG